ncbi:unnamed protein product [Pleuronectes platessa]|uniref:Uncharacterized protein n=1 Tax=Pleuronectes platessa TaxID=8262 RepID=A0A9N7YDB4_PLEPL|nr:unnamed protein product [Pleuronectes platessa]
METCRHASNPQPVVVDTGDPGTTREEAHEQDSQNVNDDDVDEVQAGSRNNAPTQCVHRDKKKTRDVSGGAPPPSYFLFETRAAVTTSCDVTTAPAHPLIGGFASDAHHELLTSYPPPSPLNL